MIAKIFYTIITICLLTAGMITASVPMGIDYQGLLTDNNGDPYPDGDYTMVFDIISLFGTPVWSSGEQTVSVVDGLFKYQLGSNVSISPTLFDNVYRSLRITVEGEVISPSTRLVAVPYAVHSQYSDSAEIAGEISNFSVSSDDIIDEVGLVRGFYPGARTINDNVVTRITYQTIHVPAPGYILAIASGSFQWGDYGPAWLAICDEVSEDPSSTTHYTYVKKDGNHYNSASVFCERVINVTSAGSYTYHFNAYVNDASGIPSFMHNGRIDLIYIPTSYGTVSSSVSESEVELKNLNK